MHEELVQFIICFCCSTEITDSSSRKLTTRENTFDRRNASTVASVSTRAVLSSTPFSDDSFNTATDGAAFSAAAPPCIIRTATKHARGWDGARWQACFTNQHL